MARHSVIQGAVTGFICALFCMAIDRTDPVQGIENWMLDGSFIVRGERATSAPITIVAIDDNSLTSLGKPLSFISPELASVIRYLASQQVNSIGIDLLIPELDRAREYFGPDEIGDADTVGQAEIDADGRVVLPVVQAMAESDESAWIYPLPQWTRPLETKLLLEGKASPRTRFGCVNLSPDDDTSARLQQLMFEGNESSTPAMSLALYELHDPGTDDASTASLPTSDGKLRINYVGPPGTIRSVPFDEVCRMADAAHESDFWKNQIVLIGVTAESQQDNASTPFAHDSIFALIRRFLTDQDANHDRMSGTEIHANTLATLIDQRFITTPAVLSSDFVLVLTGVFLGVILWHVRLSRGLLILLLHQLSWRVVSIVLFAGFDWHLEVASVMILGGVLFTSVFSLRWRQVRRALRLLKSEEVAQAVLADPRRLALHGEERTITILFSDIRSFTTYSETHEPQEVVTLLNTYFSTVIPVIQKHGGVVNQYLGDGLMVMFGAPESMQDHAERAVRAAVEVLQTVHASQALWETCGAKDFRIGIGICSGNVVVGTIGTRERLDYTAIGDSVNTAARIEALNKELKTELLIAAPTLEAMSPEQQTFWQDSLGEPYWRQLRGRTEELAIYPLPVETNDQV